MIGFPPLDLREAERFNFDLVRYHTNLVHLGTNAVWDFHAGPGTDSERRHLEEMATDFPPGSLVTADAGFIGYDLCQRLTAQSVSSLLRVGGNITLLARQWQQRIHQNGQLVWLWPQGQSHAAPCVLRLLRDRQGKNGSWSRTCWTLRVCRWNRPRRSIVAAGGSR